MDANTLYKMWVLVFLLACVNAIFWFWRAMSERRWKFIGSGVCRFCWRQMWLNFGIALVCAVNAVVAGWWA
jgi:hypothetical protein